MARKAEKPIERPSGPETVRPFAEVLATADQHGWSASLLFHRGYWVLELFERQELVARGRTPVPAPRAFAIAAQKVAEALEKSGRLK
jgi:hypothetical protein